MSREASPDGGRRISADLLSGWGYDDEADEIHKRIDHKTVRHVSHPGRTSRENDLPVSDAGHAGHADQPHSIGQLYRDQNHRQPQWKDADVQTEKQGVAIHLQSEKREEMHRQAQDKTARGICNQRQQQDLRHSLRQGHSSHGRLKVYAVSAALVLPSIVPRRNASTVRYFSSNCCGIWVALTAP